MVACWFVVTPARLTSIVKNQAPNFINCDFDIKRADLTIFKSFPKVGLEINDVVLMNPMVGSPSDTLAYIDECVVSVNVQKLLKEKQIIIYINKSHHTILMKDIDYALCMKTI